MPPTPNPLENTVSTASIEVSKKSFFIAGIVVDVLGLDEVPKHVTNVCVLWLLNPRLSNKEWMAPIGCAAVRRWNSASASSTQTVGLIAVAFDQRNHGSRLIDPRANEAWRSGNPSHAQDMFSTFQGTAVDTSVLIDYLPAFIYPENEKLITKHMVLGVSLGGHAAWHCVLHDTRISTGIVIIGCADYYRVMSDRAAKSKLKTWTSTSPPGSTFLGSKDFPGALVAAVDQYDPTGLLMGQMVPRNGTDVERQPTEQELQRLKPIMAKHLAGKSILNLAGGADKLVPYAASDPFLRWLKTAIGPGGWFAGHGVSLRDKVFDGVGHEMSKDMFEESLRFIVEQLNSIKSPESKF